MTINNSLIDRMAIKYAQQQSQQTAAINLTEDQKHLCDLIAEEANGTFKIFDRAADGQMDANQLKTIVNSAIQDTGIITKWLQQLQATLK